MSEVLSTSEASSLRQHRELQPVMWSTLLQEHIAVPGPVPSTSCGCIPAFQLPLAELMLEI